MEPIEAVNATVTAITETMEQMETYDLDHSFPKAEMYAANLVWNGLAAIMAVKAYNAIQDTDYTTAPPSTGASIWQYADMALNYGSVIFWGVGTLLQAISMTWNLVDINIMWWMVVSTYFMAIEELAGLALMYVYDANKTSATQSDIDWADDLHQEGVYDMARHAWLMVTHMSLAERWFAGQWDMLETEKRQVFAEEHEAKMQEQIAKNKAMLGIEDMDKEELAEKVEEKVEESINAAALWRTLNF